MQKFTTWIKNFKDAHSPFGDLARDINEDKNFPKSNSFKVLHSYLEGTYAEDAFLLAWEHYKSKIDTQQYHYELSTKLQFLSYMLRDLICSKAYSEVMRSKDSVAI